MIARVRALRRKTCPTVSLPVALLLHSPLPLEADMDMLLEAPPPLMTVVDE